MRKKQFPSDKSIIRCLNIYYGIEVSILTSLALGADMDASLYKAETLDQSYFVKLKRGKLDLDFIGELFEKVKLPHILPPIKTNALKRVQGIEECTLVVFPFIKGRDGFSCPLKDHQWIALGRALRQLHDIDVPPFIQSRLRQEDYSSKWQEAVRILMEIETQSDKLALKLFEFMKEKKFTIQKLVERADELGLRLKEQLPKCVLCHSDIHGGNVLIDENDAIYIIDWEPLMAPKERDLMFIGGSVGNVWNKAHEEELFYQGYGEVEVSLIALSYYRFVRILEDIALIGESLFLSQGREADRKENYKQFIAMFEKNGVVDIAFQTDKKLKG